ncbi:unnamed protein product [Clonostachys rosea f. rosea IK726]|uniref:Uncharacterized protein n=2 Tax=Bionectria ochroleuca TaxID=29856 RepID=A0A0B7JM42_BIOOC|nr:unnamed protein product [Clonostachys rosea f. rosea IK726]
MDSTRGTAARLRRTFQYPDDNHSDSEGSEPEAMDEEEQEALITRLAAENASRNASFTRVLFYTSLAAAACYLPSLLLPFYAGVTKLFSILAVTSLASTAFILDRLPPTATGIALLDGKGKTGRERDLPLSIGATQRSPLETYLPYLNLGLIAALVLMGMVTKSNVASFGWIGMGNLPAIVYIVVLVAKMVMASVDPEAELSTLKYEYKGA